MVTLETILEEWLIKDLIALKGTRVGYPILMTVFAGAELLGALLHEDVFNGGESGAGRRYFKHYWTQYLYERRNPNEAEALYTIARNGVAHQFFVKGKVLIMKGDPVRHLTCLPSGALSIDTHALIDDFSAAYDRHVRPILSGATARVNRTWMERQSARMVEDGALTADEVDIGAAFPRGAPVTTSDTTASPFLGGPTGVI
jgi:hypothetical protein